MVHKICKRVRNLLGIRTHVQGSPRPEEQDKVVVMEVGMKNDDGGVPLTLPTLPLTESEAFDRRIWGLPNLSSVVCC